MKETFTKDDHYMYHLYMSLTLFESLTTQTNAAFESFSGFFASSSEIELQSDESNVFDGANNILKEIPRPYDLT